MLLIIISLFWFASEIVLARIKRSQLPGNNTDRGSLKMLWIIIAISVNSGVFAGLQIFGHFGQYAFFYYWTGISFIVLGLVIRWIAILTLKQLFTVDVAITENHKIQKQGIYKYIRHPAYAGSLLSFLGLGLSFANLLSVAIIFLPIFIAFQYRIRIEETALTKAFGNAYIQYCATTKRLIPFVF